MGGQATTAYNLHLFLESKNYESKLLFLNDGKAPGDVDPRTKENSHNFNISQGFLTQTQIILFSIKRKLFKSKSFKREFYRLGFKIYQTENKGIFDCSKN